MAITAGSSLPLRFRALLILLAVALPFGPVATAQDGMAPDGMAPDGMAQDGGAALDDATETLERVEEYLNGLTTLESRFIQVNHDGSHAEGAIYMRRPGRMRVEYDPPSPHMLIANGHFLIYIDTELKEASHIPLGLTPAYFFLRDEISFSDGLAVVGYEKAAGLVRVTVVQEDAPDAGSVTVTFAANPLQLRQWTVVDAQNLITRVTLVNPRFGLELRDSLFRYVEPWVDTDR